ncbi:MBL fold metallo-hydrolase [Bergeyella sp. RCAD1439]|uniref:MBL fold metallo-hydrolase n=1 Tax=Bergeyella anatis TaxID=3113737 RepID=UPI002E183AC4|nr:MBL fold metallo-hydrolase [Bergeyella sp. RCAD1439]
MKLLKILGLALIALTVLTPLIGYLVMSQPKFGKAPGGKRLERIKKSPHYKNGSFQNLEPTPQLSENTSLVKVFWRFLFGKSDQSSPRKPFHFEKTDLKRISVEENVYVWMGHSSYFLQVDGLKILVDPVFSGYASPFSFNTKAFQGTDLYQPDDFPELDYLIITHDHWDHLDYNTVTALFPKVKRIITGLGTGEHLEYWGYPAQNIIELDWYEKATPEPHFRIQAEPARHFSGRGFKRDQALWSSFVLNTKTQTLYIGGDSGYGTHFKSIGERHPHIDLAILENGQYHEDWRYIHMLPGEQIQAMKDLNAQRMIPVHNSKFKLSTHSWEAPMKQIQTQNKENLRILFPKIGEKINWQDDTRTYAPWWEKERK